ncbi:MAG: hypothetical protein ACOZNI_00830 [Myxococcota bacterium]
MEEQQEIRDEGIPFSFVIALYGDERDDTPTDPELAVEYAEAIDTVDHEFPVTLDMTGTIRDQIPWAGSLPGKCAVSRELVMLECWSSDTNTKGLNAIRDDWEASR